MCLVAQPVAGGRALLRRLRDDDHPLGPGCPVPGADQGDPGFDDIGKLANGVFDLLRENVAAGPDHQILDPARDKYLPVGAVSLIAAVEPSAVEQLFGLGLVLEIARRG